MVNQVKTKQNKAKHTLFKKKINFKKKFLTKKHVKSFSSTHRKIRISDKQKAHPKNPKSLISNLTSTQIRKSRQLSHAFIFSTLINQFMRRGQKQPIEKIFTKLLLILTDKSFCPGSEFLLEAIYDHYSLMG